MPEKPRPTKKKNHASTARGLSKAAGTNAPRPKPKVAFYVQATPRAALISEQKPKGGASAGPFTTFAEAKQAAIDALVMAIEEAEEQLLAIKRAETFEQLPGASDAR